MFTGFTNAGTGANNAGAGTAAWSNPTRVQDCNASFSTATQTLGVDSQNLRATNFGFTLPTDAKVRGVKVSVTRKSTSQTIVDKSVKLLSAGSAIGSDKADAVTVWPAASTAALYGAPDDLWGATLTAAIVNASTFGVQLQAAGDGANTDTASVDCITLSVWYDTGGCDYRVDR